MSRKIQTTVTLPAALPAGTSAIDVLTTLTLGYAGKIVAWYYTAVVVATGTSADQVFNLEIGTTDVTGSAGHLLLADAGTVGKTTALGVPTALNVFQSGDAISIEMAASGTAFTAGSGYFTLVIEQSARGI